MRRRHEKLDRWHWVYTATCFRLQHRCRKGPSKNKLRAIITERSYVATREGLDALMQQLYYEARVRGLAQARRRNEPQGSGAIESTCRQLQCRMKRPGQFWSTAGDEALLALDVFWRNDRWELLFPHAQLTAVANN